MNHKQDEVFKELWLFFIYVDAIPKGVFISSEKVKVQYLTLDHIIDRILNANLKDQNEILALIEREYSAYFRFNTGLRIPQKNDIPRDLNIFNKFIKTKDWFIENPNQGYDEIYSFICSFQECLLNCSENSRNILADMYLIQKIPKELDSKIEVYLEKLFGRFDAFIDDDKFNALKFNLELLESNHLIELEDRFYKFKEDTITTEKVAVLSYRKFEPDINLLSVLPNFYMKYHSIHDFFRAIESADFSLLSDSEVRKSVKFIENNTQ